LISEIHGEINYVGKGVDINDPLLPVSMPRGYGGVAAGGVIEVFVQISFYEYLMDISILLN
jgi:hypothetical protein